MTIAPAGPAMGENITTKQTNRVAMILKYFFFVQYVISIIPKFIRIAAEFLRRAALSGRRAPAPPFHLRRDSAEPAR